MNYKVTYSDEYLMHHGILGQKWGQRNGPPYPLKPGEHSAAEKKAGYSKSIKEPSESHPERKLPKKVSDKQGVDPIIAYYATEAVATLAVYAIMEGGIALANKSLTKAMKTRLDDIRSDLEVDELTGLHKKKDGDTSDDVTAVNPKYNEYDNTGATQNCVRCTFAYELRNRGYDVSAGLTVRGVNGIKETNKLFKGVKNVEINPKPSGATLTQLRIKALSEDGNIELANKTFSKMSKEPDSRGQILVSWGAGGGHSMAYDVKGGKVRIIDAQNGKIYSDQEATDILKRSVYTQYQRLDNLEFNSEKARKYVI